MLFHSKTAKTFVPDGSSTVDVIARTTHMAIVAHQDDIEMMAAHPILECFHQEGLWFTGVVVTDGRGSPRTGIYEDFYR